MARINKAVEGLPDLLGQYQGGQVQLEVSPWVGASYDILPFIAPVKMAYNTGFAGAAPWSVKVTVPDNEMWLVNFVSGVIQLPAANDAVAAYPYFNPGIVGGAYIEYPLADSVYRYGNGLTTPTSISIAYAEFPNHLILTAGQDVGVYVHQQASAGNLTCDIAVQYHRIRT